jgi:predicted metal-binding membrane protein
MAKVRHSLLVLLAALVVMTATGWTGTSLAAAPFGQAAAQAHDDGCGHAMAPGRHHGPMSLADEMCATCCAVLPSLAYIAPRSLAPPAPAPVWVQRLSGVDPGLDPPPPRAG